MTRRTQQRRGGPADPQRSFFDDPPCAQDPRAQDPRAQAEQAKKPPARPVRPAADAPTASPLAEAAVAGADPLLVAFARFHQANRHVYSLFLGECRTEVELQQAANRDRVANGERALPVRLSARKTFEKLRASPGVKTTGSDGFKINDHHIPLYARLAIHDFPEVFAGRFETRKRKAK